jgi:hypothetical protein
MASRLSAVAFDVVETLMPLEPLGARFERAGLPASALREWFTRLLLYGVGLSAAGDYVPFPDVAAEALRAVSGYRLPGEDVEYVLAGFARGGEHRPAAEHLDALPAQDVWCLGRGDRRHRMTHGRHRGQEGGAAGGSLDQRLGRHAPGERALPPISPSATSSTRAPAAAPARAAPSPAAPPPITIRSQLSGTGQRASLAWSCGWVASSTCTPFQNATWFLILRASGLGCG